MGTGARKVVLPASLRDGRNDCDGCFTVSFSPSQPSQPSRGLFAFSIIGQRNTPPLVPDFVLIVDAVFV